MSYLLSAGAQLGPGKTGLTGTLGYRLLNLDGSVAVAFTTTNVVETGVAGNYTVTNGISVPNGFQGRLIWGISGTDYAESWVNPAEDELNAIADGVLKRGVGDGPIDTSASLASLTELILACLHSSISGTTITINKVSGAGTFNTRTATVNSLANPITGVN